MSADMKSRFRVGAKVCSGVIMVLLVIAALGPAKWAPRTELGWQFDHFIGYFGITLFVCLAWPRPLVVGESLWPSRHCWKVCKSLRRIDRLISRLHSGAQAGRWRRLSLLSSVFGYGDRVSRVLLNDSLPFPC